MRKKMIKKILVMSLVSLMVVPCFLTSNDVSAVTNANTLAELRKELADYKAKRKAAEDGKDKTQAEINQSNNEILAARTEIENNQKKIEEAKAQIEQLNIEIAETEDKIETLLRSYEVSSGDNNYLEYIFGATSISDFIIRYSISEQIASYNDELITTYEGKIDENEQLQVDLANREKELNTQIANLESAVEKLGNDLESFAEDALSFDKEVESTEQLIKEYEAMGCEENEPFSSCMKMQSDTGFLRPLKKGTITSHFGYRTHPVTGVKNKFHSGTDIGGNPEGTNVYSVANGMVGKIVRRSSCGGNQVYIYHTVNGVKYTSTYMHLLEIKVAVGDIVSNQSVIGTVGGGARTMSYDKCSTGAHLHLSMAKGWYGSTYVSYSTYVSNLFNPPSVINLPPKGTYFYTR